jgi:TonB family protein
VPRLDIPLATGGTLLIPEKLLSTSVPERTATARPSLGLDAGVEDPRAPPPPEKVVSDLVSESLGRGKVERGLVHPYFSTLGKRLLKQWDAERAVSSQGLSGFLEQARGNSQQWTRIWSERAAAYGATGSALTSDTPTQPNRRPSTGDPNLEARRELRKEMREQFRATRRAVIRVVQDAQGRLVSAELVIPSNSAQVDREALKDVRAAAELLPPPPPEALGGRTTLTSLWQFELIISISPPVPSFSFEFDEALGFVDTRLPLDRRIYKRVRLLEVN